MSCISVGHRCGLDPVLLWLWCRPVTTAPIRPLDWETLYAVGAALEMAKKNKKTKKQKKPKCCVCIPDDSQNVSDSLLDL